jgi:hypothetical protein
MVSRLSLFPEIVQHPLQIFGQRARELHAPAVVRMLEGDPGRVEERPLQVRHGA